MAITSQEYFYDNQIRRFLIQFVRIMSGFQVNMGTNSLGVQTYQQVPVIYGGSSRQVSTIIMGNSENTMPTVPAISVYISSMKYDRARLQNPTFIGKMQLHERKYDPVTNEWGTDLGESFTVERMMPVPYEMGLKVDIWTSNESQKHQLFEQISVLFNPGMEIQSSDNFIDWTSLSAVTHDTMTWSSKSVPSNDDAIDVLSMSYTLPIWLSPPAKIMKMGVIERIITSIYDESGDAARGIIDASNPTIARTIITPANARIIYSGNTLELLSDRARSIDGTILVPTSGSAADWHELIAMYGVIIPGISQIRLQQSGTQTEVVGTIAYHPTDSSLLLFTPFSATLPVNNLPPINSIIDPLSLVLDSSITSPVSGTRFLILNGIGADYNIDGAAAWKGTGGEDLVAHANDIIQYNGSYWQVSFSANNSTGVKYLINLKSGSQYRYENDEWSKAVEGYYTNSEWRIII